MPFTPSHVAAVLPFARTRLSFSALAVGSMAPDLPYYVPGLGHSATRDLTHSTIGVVSVDLVLGLVAYALWHAVLVPPAADALVLRGVEVGLRARLSSWSSRVTVVLSMALRAATHVGWDSSTPADGWGPRHLPVLSSSFGPLPGYRWAQYASGVLGLLALGWAARRGIAAARGRGTPTVARPGRKAVLVGLGAAAATLVVGCAVGFARVLDSDVRGAFFLGITRGAGVGIGILLVAAIAWHVTGGSAQQEPAARSGAA